MRIEQVRADQRDEVIAFLRKIFQAAEDAAFLDPRLMDWKYFEERPDWSGTRSYVLRAGNRIAAHGGIVSTTLLLPQRRVISVQIIDWAADNFERTLSCQGHSGIRPPRADAVAE